MKSERRHKLQENALAHSLENLPKMGRESGSKLLLGIVTVLLVIVLIQYYLRSQREKKELVAAELANARYDLGDLNGEHIIQREMEVASHERRSAELTPEERKKLLEDIGKKVDAVLAETTDVPLVAQAKNILADAYVELAVLGNPPEATTRPDLALPRPPEDLLDDASHAYQAVLDMKEGLPFTEAADAHFGLGSVAENRREWDKARTQYEAVKNDPAMPKVFTDYAALRLGVLEKISSPFVMGRPMTSPSDMGFPSSLPTTSPTTAPAAGPGTAPAAPETPATGPVTVPVAPPSLTPLTVPTTGPTTHGP
jgi:hypothetical protein